MLQCYALGASSASGIRRTGARPEQMHYRLAIGFPLDMNNISMTSIVVSTIAYFVAAFFIKRHLVEMGIPKGPTRGMVIFVGAAAVSYGVAWLVGLVVA